MQKPKQRHVRLQVSLPPQEPKELTQLKAKHQKLQEKFTQTETIIELLLDVYSKFLTRNIANKIWDKEIFLLLGQLQEFHSNFKNTIDLTEEDDEGSGEEEGLGMPWRAGPA